ISPHPPMAGTDSFLFFCPDPARAKGCDLQPVAAEPPVTLSYATSTVPRGCVSSSSLGTGREVHVLSIEWTKVGVPAHRPGVVTSSLTPGSGCRLPPQDARPGTWNVTALGTELLVANKGQLLAWAQDTYRGVTSYSELRDPRLIRLRLGEDAGSPPDCVPRENFDAAPHLEAEVFFHGVKGCSQGDAQSARAAHIVRMRAEPSSTITEVNVSLSCPKGAESNQIFILQSPAKLTCFLSVDNCNIQFLVSGNYTIMSLFPVVLRGELLPDTEQGLVAKAFEKNYSIIASYSIIPVSARISLEIQGHGEPRRSRRLGRMGWGSLLPLSHPPSSPCPAEPPREVPATPPPRPPDPDTITEQLLLMLQPWKCTDETMEIIISRSHLEPIKDVVNITLRDISCQAEKNATHFMLKTPLSHCGTLLEGRGHANNEVRRGMAAALPPAPRVDFQCSIPRELFLRLFPTAAFEAPQTELEVNKEVFVQVPPLAPCLGSREGVLLSPRPPTLMARVPSSPWQASMWWEDPPADLELKECSLLAPGWESNSTIFEKVLEVTVKDGWRVPNNRGLGLAAVLGITFGAFLIGALLTAGLWYIYSHTRPISKLQPVSSTAPASESSSTNHSIGSTQSTPCSTSSMA
ncbi:EGLN protein, partial [Centropus unirufus]|nr:EGLN protein [Centropus unirufus]